MLRPFVLLYALEMLGTAPDTARTLAQTADKVAPAVVSIRADTPAGESTGSGFIVDPLGTVVTSLHVIEGATAIRVELASGLIYDHVRVRARDTPTDLALLQLDGFGLPAVSLGDSDTLRPGDAVVVVSHPGGREGGFVAGTVRRLRTIDTGLRLIETNARAGRGSSGAPLVTMDGRVVGVLSAKLRGARGSRLAVPINDARRLLFRKESAPSPHGTDTTAIFSQVTQRTRPPAVDLSTGRRRKDDRMRGETPMSTPTKAHLGLAVGVIAVLAGAGVSARPPAGAGDAIPIDADDIGGTVKGPRGPEAGVWVIAETTELPTKFVRIVVTDDRGRYVVPDLPRASYSVWVRGYGLVDSRKVQASPGTIVDLTAVPAPDPRAAAEYYPAGYWFSLLRVPDKSEFPGSGAAGNGISPKISSQAEWLRNLKSGGCWACHQLGNKATREIPKAFDSIETSQAAWQRRILSGQAGGNMMSGANNLGGRAYAMFADWTDRIAAGEVPPAPPRPQGIERNVVITEWDWADPHAYLHDEVSTDRRNPTLNANGLIYGALELSADYLPVLDPARSSTSKVPLTVRDANTPVAADAKVTQASPYWGEEVLWTSRNNVHNPMLDERGRVWITSAVRPPDNPDVCKQGSTHPSAMLFPVNRSFRHLAVYDPSTKKLTHIGTCFSTHHLMFAEDAARTLWTSGGGPVVGWLNTKMFDETGDEAKSQGWTALVLDTNGNGKRDAYVEPDQPVDPAKDKRYGGGFYSVAPAPDGSIWGSVLGFPGAVVRLSPGAKPPETALAEVYEPPFNNPKAPVQGFSPRGADVDRNGVMWAALASGHLASFDRRKCKGPLNGPAATGQHCPEGWTLYPEPLPQMKGVTDSGSAESSYYTWVDQFGTLGLGENVPIDTGNASEGLLVLKDGKWVVLRVPYPLGYYTKWLDGRIDDPSGGWKGRGLWSTVSTRAPFHMEGGKGTTSKVIKFQLRPDPLAK